jgi:hypothetical protein
VAAGGVAAGADGAEELLAARDRGRIGRGPDRRLRHLPALPEEVVRVEHACADGEQGDEDERGEGDERPAEDTGHGSGSTYR